MGPEPRCPSPRATTVGRTRRALEPNQQPTPPLSIYPFLLASLAINDVTHQSADQTCGVDVRGVNELRIEVTCNWKPRGAHAVWIEPHLMKELGCAHLFGSRLSD